MRAVVLVLLLASSAQAGSPMPGAGTGDTQMSPDDSQHGQTVGSHPGERPKGIDHRKHPGGEAPSVPDGSAPAATPADGAAAIPAVSDLTPEQVAELEAGHGIKGKPMTGKPLDQDKPSQTLPPPQPPPQQQAGGARIAGDGVVPFVSDRGGFGGALTSDKAEALADAKTRAADCWKAGDLKCAVDKINDVLELEPANEEAWRAKGEAYQKLKNLPEAEKALKKAVALEPKDARAWRALAWALLKQGKYAEALAAAERALALDPNDAASHALRAYALEALGRHAEALAELELAARLDPRFADALARGKRGEKLFDPMDFSDDIAGRRSGGLPPWAPWAAGGAAVLLALVGLASRRRAAEPAATVLQAAPAATTRLGGKYEILRPLGSGGMGDVHEAMDHSLGRVVALKSMTRSLGDLGAKGREMFVREAKTVAALHHPAIVDIYEMVDQGETLFLVFELVRGKTLAKILAQQKRLSLQDALEILGPICEALDFAHGQGLVHRDIKPANVMVTDEGRVKLMDFGIARSVAETRRKTPTPGGAAPVTVIGTPAYMAPEATAGALRKESDVFSLGATAFEMLTGAPPTPGAKASAAAPGLPPAVDAVLAAALEPDPDRRIKTAGEFLAKFRAAAGT